MKYNKNRFTYEIIELNEDLYSEYLENQKMYDELWQKCYDGVYKTDFNKDLIQMFSEEKILEKINQIVFAYIWKYTNEYCIDFNILEINDIVSVFKDDDETDEELKNILKKAKEDFERVVHMKIDNIEMREKVVQSNALIQKRTSNGIDTTTKKKQIIKTVAAYDETQIKLLNLMISHIKPDSNQFEWEQISFYEFTKFMGLKTGGNTYKQIFDAVKKLMSLNFCLEVAPGEYKFYHFFESGSTVSINENKIVLKFDDALSPFLLGNKSQYTRYELGFMAFLKGKYTCRLYEYLHSYLGMSGPIYISVEDFKNRICNGQYNAITDFERYVINKAQSELENKADIRFSYKRKKIKSNGKEKTIGWYFTIKEKNTKEKREIAGSWGLDWDDASFDYDAPNLGEIHHKKDMQKNGIEEKPQTKQKIEIDENDDLPFDVGFETPF